MSNKTEKDGNGFVWGDVINAAGQPDGTVAMVRAPLANRSSILEALEWLMSLFTRPAVWWKGLNADMVDGCHCADLQPIDADLTAIAALTGTGFSARIADDTWALRTFGDTATVAW